jgi:hypothetical protein
MLTDRPVHSCKHHADRDRKLEACPLVQAPPPVRGELTFALQTAGDPLRYIKTVHEIVREADSRIPVTNVVTQAAEIDRATGGRSWMDLRRVLLLAVAGVVLLVAVTPAPFGFQSRPPLASRCTVSGF